MILLGVILFIIGIFVARNILWPVGGILVLVGVILLFTHEVVGGYYY